MNTPADASDTAINRLFELDQNSLVRVEAIEPAAEVIPRPADRDVRRAFRGLTLAAVALLLQACAVFHAPDDWRARDTVLEASFQAVNVLDAVTTARIKDSPWEERSALTRAVIGAKPGANETALYFASVALSHWLIARALPPKWRPWFQAGTTVYVGDAVRTNCRNGLCR